jgi:hypothetical protein
MQRQEIPNNTPEQVVAYLNAAVEAVTQSDVPPELQEIAFGKAVDLISGKQIVLTQPQAIDLGALQAGRRH